MPLVRWRQPGEGRSWEWRWVGDGFSTRLLGRPKQVSRIAICIICPEKAVPGCIDIFVFLWCFFAISLRQSCLSLGKGLTGRWEKLAERGTLVSHHVSSKMFWTMACFLLMLKFCIIEGRGGKKGSWCLWVHRVLYCNDFGFSSNNVVCWCDLKPITEHSDWFWTGTGM